MTLIFAEWKAVESAQPVGLDARLLLETLSV